MAKLQFIDPQTSFAMCRNSFDIKGRRLSTARNSSFDKSNNEEWVETLMRDESPIVLLKASDSFQV